MKNSLIILLYFSFQLISSAQTQEYYQLKIFQFQDATEMEMTDQFLSEVYMPMLKKKGFKNIGVFKNSITEKDSILKTYVLVPSNDIMSIYNSEQEIIDAYPDEKHFNRVNTIFLKAFSHMPMLKPSPLDGPRNERIYELRSYESATEKSYKNKVEMFNEGGEVKLFDELGFNAVFYAEVIAGDAMPNLMYMTTHQNQESRDQNWKAFVDSPVWNTLKAMPKYQKNVSHIDIHFLHPTEYSDY